MYHLRRNQAEPARHLAADGDTGEHFGAGKPVPLGGGQHGGYDHSAGMNRPAFERIVVVFAVSGSAVHEHGVRRRESPRVAERRTSLAGVQAGEHRSHIVGVAGGQAEAGDVQHQAPAGVADVCRQCLAPDRAGCTRQVLGNCAFLCHAASSRFAALAERSSDTME
jgi:hypothetical protein